MKKIGIVGGVAWLSTVDYYSAICRRSLQDSPSTPEMSIESLDHHRAVAYLGNDEDEESWSRFDEYHRAALKRLEASGVDFALMASNSPHHRFESIVRGVGIPVLNLLEVVARESARRGARRVLILGTSLIMKSRRVGESFAKYGVAAAGPEDEGMRSRTSELSRDLQHGRVEGTAERLANIVKASIAPGEDRPLVCLACTELPSAFPEMKMLPVFEMDGILYLNTTILHANAACDLALGG